MNRTSLRVLALLLHVSAVAASAQLQGGHISGMVTDDQGGVLPGVSVTLTSLDRTLSFTTEADGLYRFLNLPPGAYTVTFALPGFSKVVRSGIMVAVGQNVSLPIQMRVAAVEETVTVSGESPIVDARQMGTVTNFTQDELSRIPTSRDPWALLRTVPGVLVDRVNIAGNETGQQSQYQSKGVSGTQSVWTLDGVVITDMAAVGASPTYFDYDAFDEIQISTAGQDIRQQTGGVGLNMVVKRGTNQFKGGFKGYYTSDNSEGSNIPGELRVTGPAGQVPLTPATADHNDQISEYGFDVGGPILRDKAWIWGSWVKQDIRLYRQQIGGIDRTILETTNIKGNWQASSKDMISVLWFLGAKEKYGRATGFPGFEPRTATWNQGGFYSEGRPNGLLKFQDDRILTSNLFLTAKYAYYGTGFGLDPIGGMDAQGGQSVRLAQAYGSTYGQFFLRPQHTFNADANHFRTALGGQHDFKFGFGYRRTDAFGRVRYPGDQVYAYDDGDRTQDKYVAVYREGAGTDRTEYLSLYAGDTMTRNRFTLDLGLRYDRQWGSALPSETQSNGAFPNLVPGIKFAGYDAPFTWNNVSPRVGVTFALDEARKTLVRGSVTRGPGQLDSGTVAYANPSRSVGYSLYEWNDLNSDHLATPNEVRLDRFITSGGGFNAGNPTAAVSANRIDPDLKAPVTTMAVAGIDRELMPNLAVQFNYTHTRTTDYSYTPRVRANGSILGPEFYAAAAAVTGTIPGGGSYSIPTFIANAAEVTAAGGGRIITNYTGFASAYNGLEFSVIKRMSNRWMARFAGSYNNATETYDMDPAVNALGNPTRRDTEPLVDGGQFTVRTAGSGAGDVFVNGKWQFNLNGAYQLGWDLEVAGNLFGRQGTAYPLQRTVNLGGDTQQRVLVTPDVDTRRLDDLWNFDLRVSKTIRYQRFNVKVDGDLFNVFNGSAVLNRVRNVASVNFDRITQNLSPRIFRVGVRVGF